jgi:hypothetical protein
MNVVEARALRATLRASSEAQRQEASQMAGSALMRGAVCGGAGRISSVRRAPGRAR